MKNKHYFSRTVHESYNPMAKNRSLIQINSTIEKVWEALTNPEMVKLWQFGSVLKTNWKVGTESQFTTEWEGTVFEQWGIIQDVQENKLIKYTLFAPRPDLEDKPENYFLMIYQLTKEANHVMLEIIQEDNRPGAVQEEDQGEENPILLGLKHLVEAN